jgi:hypothetical protein
MRIAVRGAQRSRGANCDRPSANLFGFLKITLETLRSAVFLAFPTSLRYDHREFMLFKIRGRSLLVCID